MIAHAAAALLLALAAPPPAAPPATEAAVADATRPAADQARDADRKPAQMLAFAGVKPGQTVMDLMPGGGYFTRLFSAAVGPGGRVIAYVPGELAQRMPQALAAAQAVAAEPGRGNVTVAQEPLLKLPADASLDIVWTAQNYHDLHDIPGLDVAAFDKAVFRALKPGGVFVVLDHVGLANSRFANTGDLHRVDPAAVRGEVLSAGFAYAGESRALANPADPHTAKVFDPAIRGHTDQFVYRFRKPG